MKYTLLALLLLSHGAYADEIRDTKVYPLTKQEVSALRAASSLARELGQKVSPKCVNASFTPGTQPVHIQFYKSNPGEAPFCVDAHNSITVKFDETTGVIIGMDVLDT
ncbi:MAG: hypothetical protein K2Q18_11875 [Bdellovibrionales bacterium]|nr:hypothetical protein [Bdellovibrionales bacterium]